MSSDFSRSNFQESVDSFTVTFGGENKIDAELFTKTINNTVSLVKSSAHIIDPDSFLRLEIKSNKEGSFETCIDAIARYSVDLFTKENTRLATEIVGGFLAFLQIKQHLKGHPPKEVNLHKNDHNIIINQDNAILLIDKRISDAYFTDCAIDRSISAIFNDLKEGRRESFSVEKKDEKAIFPVETLDAMGKNIVNRDNAPQGTEDTQTIERCELIIKKPDLLGASKWEMVLDKKITVTIEDEDFLKKIKNGAIKISGGYRLVCSLEIKKSMDENYEILDIEYSIKKVHEIRDREKQLELFQ